MLVICLIYIYMFEKRWLRAVDELENCYMIMNVSRNLNLKQPGNDFEQLFSINLYDVFHHGVRKEKHLTSGKILIQNAVLCVQF